MLASVAPSLTIMEIVTGYACKLLCKRVVLGVGHHRQPKL